MITGELRNQVDKLWTEFWTGGITNPLMVIEQISFLMFARLLDIHETREEKKAKRTRKDFNRIFPRGKQNLRWSQFKNVTPAAEMLRLMRDEVFPHFKEVMLNGGALAEYMKDAQLMIQKPNLLVSAVNMIDRLPLTKGDTKGDLYEYLLSKLTTAGINGQFRTPRHIIRKMVEIVDPRPDETIGAFVHGAGARVSAGLAFLALLAGHIHYWRTRMRLDIASRVLAYLWILSIILLLHRVMRGFSLLG